MNLRLIRSGTSGWSILGAKFQHFHSQLGKLAGQFTQQKSAFNLWQFEQQEWYTKQQYTFADSICA